MKRLMTGAALAVALLLSSRCTSYQTYQKAADAEVKQDWDQAVVDYTKALQLDPGNMKYKLGLQRSTLEASRAHFFKGKTLRAAGQTEMAALELQLAVRLDPTNQYAEVELEKAARTLQDAKDAANNRTSYDAMKKRASVTKAQPPQLNPASEAPISLSFPRPTPVKDIYRALGNSFGINILFDQSVKEDEKVTIELKDVTAQQALERVMQAANHFYKTLDSKTIIIVADTQQLRRDYEDLVIQTFYLSNGDAEQVANIIRTMLEARNVFPLKALNAITIRDTADKVRIAEKIIDANDKAKAEVVVDVELLQMDLTKSRELGLEIASAGSSGFTQFEPLGTLVDSTGTAVSSLTLAQLKDFGQYSWSFNVPSLLTGLIKSVSDAELLAKPQLRISEGEKATLHIGQRIPVPVSTFTSASTTTGGTFAPVTSFQYQDVGIKISIEPRVHHNDEVTLKLTVEASDLAGFEPATSPPQPIIGTRNIESTIRLKDGETNFLAGLIQKNDSNENDGTPFLSDIPFLGRLFSKETKNSTSTDLVLTMTPHIIRKPDISEDDLAPMWVGTSDHLTFRGSTPRVESQSNGGDPFNSPTKTEQPIETAPPEQPAGSPIPGLPANGGAPNDPFKQPPSVPPPGSAGSPSGSSNLSAEAVFPQSVPVAMATLSPRISPQPAVLAIKPGEKKTWSLMAMDVQGMTSGQITLHYDPRSIKIEDVLIGRALQENPGMPLLTKVNEEEGTITIGTSDGKPLSFVGGGDIVTLEATGTAPGEAFLTIEPFDLLNSNGQKVEATIVGGKAEVQ